MRLILCFGLALLFTMSFGAVQESEPSKPKEEELLKRYNSTVFLAIDGRSGKVTEKAYFPLLERVYLRK